MAASGVTGRVLASVIGGALVAAAASGCGQSASSAPTRAAASPVALEPSVAPAARSSVPPAPAVAAPSTAPRATFAAGARFSSRCVEAWPTAPQYTSTAVVMTMTCDAVSTSVYQFVQVQYDDPSFRLQPDETVMVNGQVADVATSQLGYKVLLVLATTVRKG